MSSAADPPPGAPAAPPAFASIDEVSTRLAAQGYVAERALATTIFLADRLAKPILAEGPAGVGKTELAKALAAATGFELVRLQCYEGLDEAKTLYEWEYPKQLLYTQILRDKISERLSAAPTLRDAVDAIAAEEDAFFSERFLLQRPLLRAIRAPHRTVLLIDEVDRAEQELEAFFLEVLAELQVTVPELGTLRAQHRPLVILTSNNTRELSDALRRRCLHLWMDYPDAGRESAILAARVPEASAALAAEVVRVVQTVRALDLKKKPSVAEAIDWLRALVVLNVESLDAALVKDTLNVLLKYEGDAAVAMPRVEAALAGGGGAAGAR
jgi:MoxR-like ATPase